MKKYKVLFNDREFGPYLEKELKDLLEKEFFPLFVKCREFGENHWKPISHFKELNIKKDSSSFSGLHFLKNLKKELPNDSKKTAYQKQLKRKKNEGVEVSTKSSIAVKDESMDLDKTLITTNTLNYLNEEKKKRDDNLEEVFGDSTEIYDLQEFKIAAQEAEQADDIIEKKEELPKNKRILYLIVISAIILWFFYEEDEIKPKGISFVTPVFSVPISREKINADMSLSLKDDAKKVPNYGLLNLMKKAQLIKEAVSYNNTDQNMQALMRTYSKLLYYSSNLKKDAAKVYKMFGFLKGSNNLNNPSIVDIRSSFYVNTRRFEPAVEIVENYLNLNKKVSASILSNYLLALLETGNYDKARNVVKKLLSSPQKSVDSYVAILKYLEFENKFESFGKLFGEAYKDFPDSLKVLNAGAKYFILKKDYDNLEQILIRIKNQKFGYFHRYFGYYLEAKGTFYALTEDYNKAQKYFQKAININPNSEIISKLSTLSTEKKYSEFSILINKSKAISEMLKARKFMKEKNWELASTSAISAVDAFEEFIPARVLLAEIQIKKGYLKDAIKGLLKYRNKVPKHHRLNLILLKAYIESYQFYEASVLISELNQSKAQSNDDYALILSDFYKNKGDHLRKNLWIQNALKINPINEEALYRLANNNLNVNNFSRSKKIILKLIELNPSSVKYKIVYSKILYELEGVDTGLGYLRKISKKYPNKIEIQNQIAIFYYKNGQIKNYEDLLKKLNVKSEESSFFYEFLMKTALLEDKSDEYIKHAKEYLILNPADHKIRISLAEFYIEKKMYDKADSLLIELKNKVNGYPRTYYLLSLLALKQNDLDSAKSLAEEEIFQNKYLVDGYIQLGNVYIAQEDYNNAEVNYKKAQRIELDNIEVLKGLAEVKYRKNQLEGALELLNQVLDLSEVVETEVYYKLGLIQQRLGRTKAAGKSYKTYLQLYPDSPNRAKIETYLQSI